MSSLLEIGTAGRAEPQPPDRPLEGTPPHRARSYIETLLERILEAVSSEPEDSSSFKRDKSVVLDGAGAATFVLATPAQGMRQRVKHLTLIAAGAAAIAEVYLEGVNDLNLVARQTGLGRAVLADTPGIPIPPNTNLVVQITGGTPGGAATAVAWGEIEHAPPAGSMG